MKHIHHRGAMLALAVLCALQLLALLRAPSAHYAERVTLSLARGQAVTLGQRELGLPQPARIALRRAGDGRWWLRNLQAERPLLLRRDGQWHRLGAVIPRAGQRLQIGHTLFTVTRADADALDVEGGGHRWRYDGARVLRDGAVQPPCPGAGTSAAWNAHAPRFAAFERPLAFGGNLHCGNRIGIPYTEPGSARVAGMVLTAAIPILADGRDPASAETPLDGIEAIGIGRTRLAVEGVADSLRLRLEGDAALFPDPASRQDPVASEWRERAAWHLPGLAGPALVLLACAALSAARRHPAAIPAAIALAGAAAMILQRAGTPPGIGVSMLLGWAALWCFLCLLCGTRKPTLAGACAVLLLAVGMLVQLEMALGAPSSGWARHFQKTCALLALGLGAGAVLRTRAAGLPARVQVEYALAAMAAAALLGLGLQVAAGDETGVFDLQPVEFAKLALAALSAHCIAVGLGAAPEKHGAAMRWWRLAAPALLLAALCALALAGVNDYSPLLLLLVWAGGTALAWAAATRRAGLFGVLLGGCVLAATAIGALRGLDGAELSQWGFYADRFEVWLDPAAHPHTGQQMLLAGRAIGHGGWWGADGLLGLTALGGDAGAVLAVPAIADDFAPAFFIHRHGLAGALLLWGLQAAFLIGLLRTAAAGHARAAGARDFRLAWLGRFQCFFLAGGAAFVAGHLLLSWGTNLAILPIMGQPMSFLSAGGSHLLLFICPLLTMDAISGASATRAAPDTHSRRVDHAGLRTT